MQMNWISRLYVYHEMDDIGHCGIKILIGIPNDQLHHNEKNK